MQQQSSRQKRDVRGRVVETVGGPRCYRDYDNPALRLFTRFPRRSEEENDKKRKANRSTMGAPPSEFFPYHEAPFEKRRDSIKKI